MDLLLYYIYTGQVQDFNKVSVVDLFKAADRLAKQIDEQIDRWTDRQMDRQIDEHIFMD